MKKRVKKISCYCINCNKFIGKYYFSQLRKTCSKECFKIFFSGKNNPNFRNHKLAGKANPNFKNGGETAKKHYCKICGESEITYQTWKFGKGMCHSCATKKAKNNLGNPII